LAYLGKACATSPRKTLIRVYPCISVEKERTPEQCGFQSVTDA
jgi:hypothetical protein